MTLDPTGEFILAQVIALSKQDLQTAAVLTNSMTREQLADGFQTLATVLTLLAFREGHDEDVKRVLAEALGVDPW